VDRSQRLYIARCRSVRGEKNGQGVRDTLSQRALNTPSWCLLCLQIRYSRIKVWFQNAGQNRNIEIASRSFKNVTKLTYIGMTVTNQNLINEEVVSRSIFFCPFVCCLET
jgi:hypothetical protein